MYDHEELHRINWGFWRRFRWYRRKKGGFWVYSEALGWQINQNSRYIAMDLELAARCPELYGGGAHIEDHRSVGDFDVHPA